MAAYEHIIRPIIEEASNIAPAFSRIYKEMVLIPSDQNPLPHTEKGPLVCKVALDVYKGIIALYKTVDSMIKVNDNVTPPESWVLTDVQAWIVEQAADLLSGRKVSASMDML
ncbi:hypothetical protein H2248_007926 [Termitomyces sp. 'cryptogamus']|nr:hypothetical protein H2248_007926 [Termitomyces sp. 'cryptogamus']